MAPKVVLQLTPVAGTRFAGAYPSEKMGGRGYLPLVVLGNEPAAEVEQQLRDRFSKFRPTRAGSMTTAVRMAYDDEPVKKPLGTYWAVPGTMTRTCWR